MKMQQKVEENGAQFEFRQEVEKILVEDGKVTGVRTARGDVIHADYVVSAAYPNKVYTQMIEPASEVPPEAIQMINARRLSVCPVSIIMVIEGTPEENGITNYSTFSGDTLDTNVIWQNGLNLTEPLLGRHPRHERHLAERSQPDRALQLHHDHLSQLREPGLRPGRVYPAVHHVSAAGRRLRVHHGRRVLRPEAPPCERDDREMSRSHESRLPGPHR